MNTLFQKWERLLQDPVMSSIKADSTQSAICLAIFSLGAQSVMQILLDEPQENLHTKMNELIIELYTTQTLQKIQCLNNLQKI